MIRTKLGRIQEGQKIDEILTTLTVTVLGSISEREVLVGKVSAVPRDLT